MDSGQPAPLAAHASTCGDLADAGRLAALAESGLGPRADHRMEWFAHRVRRWLDVPVSLVSLVRVDEQVFPGAAGLGEPFDASRRTPLTHSFCQHVVVTGRPLVIQDAHRDELVSENPAIRDLGVVAYAGMPLTDDRGHVLGSLCAIDRRPRVWSTRELEALADLAASCSTELRLRLARVDADHERSRRDRLEASLRDSDRRNQALLRVSRSVANSLSIDELRAGLDGVILESVTSTHVEVLVLDEGGAFRPLPEPDGRATGQRSAVPGLGALANSPSSQAVRERRILFYPSRREFDDAFPAESGTRLRDLGLQAVAAAPIFGEHGVVGALVLGWNEPRTFSSADRLLISTVSTYIARAIDHVSWVQHRVSVAREMQQAMLSTVPTVPGLEIAASYRPADAEEYVGGDWFDVLPLVDPEREGETAVAVSVGDIVGHELAAAIDMGQVRSMLRQAAWDRPAGPPSSIVNAFETANAGIGLNAAGSAVLACLRRRGTGRWTMTWTNAGHPPPIIVGPDGRADLLTDHGRLFGLPRGVVEGRRDQEVDVPAEGLLFFYSDGLVERPGQDLDARIDTLRALLAAQHDRPVAALVDAAVTAFGPSGDDVVAVAIRCI